MARTEAYLTLDGMAETLHYGQLHFSELPYLERLFRIISRKTAGKLFFEEYVVGISTFCLMSSEAVLHFVFDWLDEDGDGKVYR
jgi:Ca2+-binding EF-hand superfamily protein